MTNLATPPAPPASAKFAHILIGTPSYSGRVAIEYFISVLNATAALGPKGLTLETFVLGGNPNLHLARNSLVAEFLSRSAPTHLLFVDDDIGFEADQIVRMVEFDQDFVGGIAPQRREAPGQFWLEGGLIADRAPEIRGSFIEAGWAGTGFLLLKRSVLERMVEAYAELSYLGRQNHDTGEAPVRHDLFCPMRDEAGYMIEEDLSFCARWRAIGGRIWLDGEGQLTHTVAATKYSEKSPGDELLARL